MKEIMASFQFDIFCLGPVWLLFMSAYNWTLAKILQNIYLDDKCWSAVQECIKEIFKKHY